MSSLLLLHLLPIQQYIVYDFGGLLHMVVVMMTIGGEIWAHEGEFTLLGGLRLPMFDLCSLLVS